MSGFSNESGGGSGKYANFKEGKIKTKIDGEEKIFTTLTGLITSVWTTEEQYQGKDYTKINVQIEHNDDTTILGFPMSSGYGNSFCRFLPSINIEEESAISGVTQTDKVDPNRKYGRLFIAQGGENLKWFYSEKAGNENKIPAVEEKKVGKQKVKDYTKREEFFAKLIHAFDKKLQKAYGEKEKKLPKDAADVTEPIDDLPF